MRFRIRLVETLPLPSICCRRSNVVRDPPFFLPPTTMAIHTQRNRTRARIVPARGGRGIPTEGICGGRSSGGSRSMR